jgi:hypothetical protein
MKIEQSQWVAPLGWQPSVPQKLGADAQLVLLFGGRSLLLAGDFWSDLKQAYPQAHYLGCSTAGEICDTRVTNDSLVVTAIQFEHTQIQGHIIQLQPEESSLAAGARLSQMLDPVGLTHVFLLSDGLQVNGSDLVRGLTQHLPKNVTVTGGLSGDDDRFMETLVLWDGSPAPGRIAALGLYGERIKVGFASLGGWSPFGPERLITRSQGNTLYELDGQPALELYKKYLGEHADGLPATGLLFPLSLRIDAPDLCLVRTILAVDEAEQSLTFAGDVPEGTLTRLMHASFERLIDGAVSAAEKACQPFLDTPPDLAILISCLGRKLLLRQRIEEEVEGVRDVVGNSTVLTGFYSYGEIAPFSSGAACELHNQTMTITTLAEV